MGKWLRRWIGETGERMKGGTGEETSEDGLVNEVQVRGGSGEIGKRMDR